MPHPCSRTKPQNYALTKVGNSTLTDRCRTDDIRFQESPLTLSNIRRRGKTLDIDCVGLGVSMYRKTLWAAFAAMIGFGTVACKGSKSVVSSGKPASAQSPDATWADPETGLIWQSAVTMEKAVEGMRSKSGGLFYRDAVKYCANNVPGLPGNGWRLPTIDELRTLVRGCPATEAGGTCGVTGGCLTKSCDDDSGKDVCNGCKLREGPTGGYYFGKAFLGITQLKYATFWSSSLPSDWRAHGMDGPDSAWTVSFISAEVDSKYFGHYHGVMCVRSLQ